MPSQFEQASYANFDSSMSLIEEAFCSSSSCSSSSSTLGNRLCKYASASASSAVSDFSRGHILAQGRRVYPRQILLILARRMAGLKSGEVYIVKN